jgi:O-antigen/teichoic acid export membrane protein
VGPVAMNRDLPMKPKAREAQLTALTGRARKHLSDELYRTGYYLIIGTGVTSVLGVAFWGLAARLYTAHSVGLNAASISAMTLVSGVCSLGLSAVLIRYLPISGTATRLLILRSYVLTLGLSLACGFGVALASPIWSPALSFLQEPEWLIGFPLATAGLTIFTLQDSVLTGLRAARWIPIENSLYSAGKLVLLVAVTAALPLAGPFVAWNVPLLPAVILINWLILRRILPRFSSHGLLERRKVLRMAAGNFSGSLFGLFANMYVPVLVANQTSPTEAAYFYVPWLISLSLQLVAINVMTSLTVEAATDLRRTRALARQALAHSMRLVAPLALLTALVAPVGLLLFGRDYADAGTPLLRLLALSAIPNVIVSLGMSIARLEHRPWTIVVAQAANAALLIGLGAVLLSSNGIEGIGIAFTISQTLIALALLGGILRPLLFGRPSGDAPRDEDGPSQRRRAGEAQQQGRPCR